MPLKFSSPLPSIEGATEWIGNAPTDADLMGKPVFVQFWAVWCGYCLMNAPLIAGWKEQYGALGLTVLTVHAGPIPPSQKGTLADAIEAHGILTPCAFDENHVLGARFQTGGVSPAYFFFDANNRLRSRAAGMQGLHLVEASIRRTLGLSELVVGARQRIAMKRRAFTLIEILVVVGILAVLAAILFPAFGRAREKGRSASCQENLHQIGLATLLYTGDYDSKFPLGGDPIDINSSVWRGEDGGKWAGVVPDLKPLPGVMSAYLKSPGTWRCPSDSGFDHAEGREGVLTGTRPSCADKWGMSYFYNTRLALTQKTIAGLQAYDNFTPYDTYGADQISVFYDASGSWHGGQEDERRYNVLMADGHVKSQNRAQFRTQLELVFDPPT